MEKLSGNSKYHAVYQIFSLLHLPAKDIALYVTLSQITLSSLKVETTFSFWFLTIAVPISLLGFLMSGQDYFSQDRLD